MRKREDNAEAQRYEENDGRKLRSFLALEIPQDVLSTTASSRRELERRLPRARWIPRENQHLTLRFLGEVPEQELVRMARGLKATLKDGPELTVSLGGGGFFPQPSRPRVAWIGGEARGIDGVLKAVDERALGLGLGPRSTPWSLHLTQARLKRAWPPRAVRSFLDWAESLDLPPFQARELVVFISDLRPGGAVYTALERIQLP